MPIAASPASKTPGVSFVRGSFTSEPVMPGGNGFACSGANGSCCCAAGGLSGFFVGSCDGDGDAFCANVVIAKHEDKARAVNRKRKAVVCTRFIVSPLRVFTQHGLHDPDFCALTAVDISREVE